MLESPHGLMFSIFRCVITPPCVPWVVVLTKPSRRYLSVVPSDQYQSHDSLTGFDTSPQNGCPRMITEPYDHTIRSEVNQYHPMLQIKFGTFKIYNGFLCF